jgi:hypothetical protein
MLLLVFNRVEENGKNSLPMVGADFSVFLHPITKKNYALQERVERAELVMCWALMGF